MMQWVKCPLWLCSVNHRGVSLEGRVPGMQAVSRPLFPISDANAKSADLDPVRYRRTLSPMGLIMYPDI